MEVLTLIFPILRRQNDPGTATMLATLCVAANAGIIGLPLLHLLFGAKAAVLAAIANIVVVAFLLVQVVGLEAAKPPGSAGKSSTLAPIWHALLNPVVLATLLGVLCS